MDVADEAPFLSSLRHMLEKYKTCENAEAVSAMQEEILAELEKSYDESRRPSGERSSLRPLQEDCVKTGFPCKHT